MVCLKLANIRRATGRNEAVVSRYGSLHTYTSERLVIFKQPHICYEMWDNAAVCAHFVHCGEYALRCKAAYRRMPTLGGSV